MTVSASPEIDHSGLSHVGIVREDNQDSIRLSETTSTAERGLLYAIADGMGGYSHGGVASQTALAAFYETFYESESKDIRRDLKRSVDAANLGVFQASQRLGAVRMGTTLTAVNILGQHLTLTHVGDSRAYLIRDKRATLLSADHTTVGEMVRARIISADKVRTHAQRSVLTKGLGLKLFVQADITQHSLQDDDRLILCSDGVWSMIQDDEFAKLAADSRDAQTLSQNLIDLAIDRESDDNVSVIAIHLQRLASTPEREVRRGWSWPNLLRKRVYDQPNE
jgi:serine/threonine protein phosphatase PrpC